MQDNMKIFPLEGRIQHYSWGGSSFIPELLHLSNPEKKPFAEYWMGAHDNASSILNAAGQPFQALNELIREHPAETLGGQTASRFGRLPYLFKVLDVKDMLSIQVHPSKEAAVKAYEEENNKGIVLDAPHRNYKDNNHKPELMLALSEFWLLHGFKPVDLTKMVLQRVHELRFLLPVFEQGGYPALYRTVMNMDQEEVNGHLQPLLNRIAGPYEKGELQKNDEHFWAARAAKTFSQGKNIDRGIFSVYLFNLVQMQPGEAIFQDAGIPHAYLEGQNMEIMANSDNVLRGGLTNKHIDIAELMKHVRFEPLVPHILHGQQTGNSGEEVYKTVAADFELHRIRLGVEDRLTVTAAADIFFVYKGAVEFSSGAEYALGSGKALWACAGAHVTLRALEPAVVFRATVPE